MADPRGYGHEGGQAAKEQGAGKAPGAPALSAAPSLPLRFQQAPRPAALRRVAPAQPALLSRDGLTPHPAAGVMADPSGKHMGLDSRGGATRTPPPPPTPHARARARPRARAPRLLRSSLWRPCLPVTPSHGRSARPCTAGYGHQGGGSAKERGAGERGRRGGTGRWPAEPALGRRGPPMHPQDGASLQGGPPISQSPSACSVRLRPLPSRHPRCAAAVTQASWPTHRGMAARAATPAGGRAPRRSELASQPGLAQGAGWGRLPVKLGQTAGS